MNQKRIQREAGDRRQTEIIDKNERRRSNNIANELENKIKEKRKRGNEQGEEGSILN